MGLTEGERGFEQTKECYLTKVIPFFKTIKEHLEGIQKALIKEVKEMKEIFEQMEAEDTLEFDTVFEINKMKASLQGKDNTIRKLKVQISQLKETRSEADRTLDFRALDFQCVVKYLTSVNTPPNVKKVLSKVKQVWKATRNMFINVGYQWKPTGKKFTLGEQCPLTRLTRSKGVPLQKPEHVSSSVIVITEKLSNTSHKPSTRYKCRNTQDKATSTSIPTIAKTQTTDAFVKYTPVSANQ
ncbi:hypothetical protein Tco_1368639 [Tanacetum coccineum]